MKVRALHFHRKCFGATPSQSDERGPFLGIDDLWAVTDLNDPESTEEQAGRTVAKLGSIDILINNAGMIVIF